MTVIYNRIQCNFTQVSNIALLDSNLSSKAYKLYAYMCYRIGISSSWNFNEHEILKHFKEGREAIRNAFKELIEAGFLVKIQIRNLNGSFGKNNYEIFAEPENITSKPSPKNPSSANPSTGKPMTDNWATYNNKEVNNKDFINKNPTNKKTPPTPSSPNQEEKSVLPHHQFGVLENGRDLINKITDKTLVKAKENAPGWDIYYLADVYVEGISKRGMPDNLNLAFPEWCKRYTKGKRP